MILKGEYIENFQWKHNAGARVIIRPKLYRATFRTNEATRCYERVLQQATSCELHQNKSEQIILNLRHRSSSSLTFLVDRSFVARTVKFCLSYEDFHYKMSPLTIQAQHFKSQVDPFYSLSYGNRANITSCLYGNI